MASLELMNIYRTGARRRPIFLYLISILMLLLMMVGMPTRAGAHASLVDASPAANAELQQAPDKIVLTFNERLEEGVYYIKVFDRDQHPVTTETARMNETRTVLELPLPKLKQGSYVVTYHIISEDGHPVEGTYLFAVGQSLDRQADAPNPNMEHMHSHGLSTGVGATDVLSFASRILYYMLMLVFSGWVLWLRFGKWSGAGARPLLEAWGMQLQRGYLLSFLFFMFVHLYAMIGDSGPEGLKALFLDTEIGYIWMGSLLLSLLGFVVLYRYVWLDLVWVALLWLLKSMNGHAAAFEPQAQTIWLDVIHLASAALWTGGLLMLLVLWRKRKEEALAFFPRFSAVAGYSLILLAVSGVLTTFIFLPDIRYITETQWGWLLLAKTGLMLCVLLTGVLLRLFFRKQSLKRVTWLLRIDAVLALLIICIVGVFTYLTPLPANEPLNWHVMGDKIHMTAQITPNAPGMNNFTVKVWLPEASGKPKQVLLKLKNTSTPDIAPIEVPLVYTEDSSADESYGLTRHTYKARGAYLPYPGFWNIEIRVMDANDDETVYEKQIRLF